MRYSQLGATFCLAVALPTAGGIWLDRKLGTVVLFTLLGLVLGFAAGVYNLYIEVFGKKKDGNHRSSPKDHRPDKTSRGSHG
ncbi:MAG: AtpZ/AtpI family protein [Planctomycetes bacterium]|nr:AtpZ/AtpI family protein [Planctomycetota bacterium]